MLKSPHLQKRTENTRRRRQRWIKDFNGLFGKDFDRDCDKSLSLSSSAATMELHPRPYGERSRSSLQKNLSETYFKMSFFKYLSFLPSASNPASSSVFSSHNILGLCCFSVPTEAQNRPYERLQRGFWVFLKLHSRCASHHTSTKAHKRPPGRHTRPL